MRWTLDVDLYTALGEGPHVEHWLNGENHDLLHRAFVAVADDGTMANMGDYRLEGLNPRDFEHLVQALLKKEVAAAVRPFGDGPDGAREATYEGRMDYPSTTAPWEGYLVVQCKFKQRIEGGAKDGSWLANQLKKDLAKFLSRRRKLRRPEFYIIVTNVTLTAKAQSGGKDKVTNVLKEFERKLGLKASDVWSYDELSRFIDGNASIRTSFLTFITPGDVLAEALKLVRLERPDFHEVMGAFLQKQLVGDESARLESAGETADRQIPLANVFVDLPAVQEAPNSTVGEPSSAPSSVQGIVGTLIRSGSCLLRASLFEEEMLEGVEARYAHELIIGGPGQGKSTLAQYLCQLHRAALLNGRRGLTREARAVVAQLARAGETGSPRLPAIRRFPVRIVLDRYAAKLAEDAGLTLLRYIRDEVSRLGSGDCSLADLKEWLRAFSWLVVLDGLDEVPASGNRSDVLRMLGEFQVDVANLDADVQLICTTRPQGFSGDVPRRIYRYWRLSPLSAEQALAYGRRLADNRSGGNDERRETVMERLGAAVLTQATARLMQTPLQVTIMAILLEAHGTPPRARYRLFSEYYDTIYRRETEQPENVQLWLLKLWQRLRTDGHLEFAAEAGMHAQLSIISARRRSRFESPDVWAELGFPDVGRPFDLRAQRKATP